MMDQGNDGTFESIFTLPYDSWNALDYFDNVDDDFVFEY